MKTNFGLSILILYSFININTSASSSGCSDAEYYCVYKHKGTILARNLKFFTVSCCSNRKHWYSVPICYTCNDEKKIVAKHCKNINFTIKGKKYSANAIDPVHSGCYF